MLSPVKEQDGHSKDHFNSSRYKKVSVEKEIMVKNKDICL